MSYSELNALRNSPSRTMYQIALAAVLALLLGTKPSSAEFIGELKLLPAGCEQTGECELGEDFGYVDPRGKGWQAAKGNVTDGASIPRWAQIFVGVPFDRFALPAAVLHDHYSKSVRPVRGWFETQRMFYEALLEGGVGEPRASLMYAGVLIGSGKWITRMEGRQCDIGETCLYDTVQITLERENEIYDSDEYRELMAAISEDIENGATGRDAVEALARAARPDDIFLHNPSGIISDGIKLSPMFTE